MKYLVVFLFTFVCCSVSLAQHPYYYSINDENGLPSNEVYEVIQDRQGYMWIASDAGLFKYDGFSFTPFESPNQNSKSVSRLQIDPFGNIWCQNFAGQLFKTNGNRLQTVIDVSSVTRRIPEYTIDSKGTVWLAINEEILHYSNAGKKLNRLNYKTLQLNHATGVADIETDQAGNVVVLLSDGQLRLISFSNGKLSVKKLLSPLNRTYISSLIKHQDKTYVLAQSIDPSKGNFYYLSELVKNKGILQLKKLNPNLKGSHYFFQKGTAKHFWHCSSDGAFELDHSLQKVTRHLFPQQKISSVYRDREGNTWFTSLQEGIYVVPSVHVTLYNKTNSALTDNNCYSLYHQQQKGLFVGTYNGEIFRIQQQHLSKFLDNPTNTYGAVRKMEMYNKQFYAARRWLTINEKAFASNNIRNFQIIGDSLVYVASDRTGIIALKDIPKQNYGRIIRAKGGRTLCVLPDGTIYFAFDAGLYRYKNDQLTPVNFRNKPIFATHLDWSNGALYMATSNEGILVLKNGIVKPFAPHLKKNEVKSLFIDNNWMVIGTNTGFELHHLLTKKVKRFNKYDGIPYKELNDIAVVDDFLYLATIRGIIRIPIHFEGFNKVKPYIQIKSVSVDNLDLKNHLHTQLPADFQRLKINFTSACFKSRGDFTYQFRLKGFDKTWRTTSAVSPFTVYTSLPAGSYLFEVVAVNEDGVKSAFPSRFKLTVNAHYWERWWFYLLIVLFTIGLVSFIFLNRLRIIKRRANLLQQLTASQLTALKAQMNPHFMFNALNSIQSLVVQQDIKNTNKYLSKFSSLMRKVLDASNLESTGLQEEVEILNLYLELEQLRFGDDFHFAISIDPILEQQALSLPPMVIQPYVENAIKHGLLHKKGPKSLQLRFYLKEAALTCDVQDNGVGRERSQSINLRTSQHTSFASNATEKRMELLKAYTQQNYKVEIIDLNENGIATGTLVQLSFPQD